MPNWISYSSCNWIKVLYYQNQPQIQRQLTALASWTFFAFSHWRFPIFFFFSWNNYLKNIHFVEPKTFRYFMLNIIYFVNSFIHLSLIFYIAQMSEASSIAHGAICSSPEIKPYFHFNIYLFLNFRLASINTIYTYTSHMCVIFVWNI